MFRPPADLAPFVSDFVIVEVPKATSRLRLPELGLVLGLRYRGAAHLDANRLPNATLAGLARSARSMHTDTGSAVILARFRPGGASAFFREPLHELADRTLDLEEILQREQVHSAGERLGVALDDAERVEVLASLLRECTVRALDPIVQAALQQLEATGGRITIRELARTLSISQDPLEKRFRRAVGTTPKRFASLVRVTRAVEAYRSGMRLVDLAVQAGYFDQSHFIREVRAFTGLRPSELVMRHESR